MFCKSRLLLWRAVLLCVVLCSSPELSWARKGDTSAYLANNELPFQWTPSTNLTRWWQPWELCMLENKEPLKNMAKLKKKCLKLHGHGSVPTTGFRCHIGHVYNGRPCISHSARNISLHDDLWRMRWAVKGYDDPSVDYAGQMMQSLHALNASLLMLGDSLTRQLNSALFCELTRSTSVQLPWWLTATMDRVSRVYVGDDKHERYRSYQEWRQAVSRLGLEKADDLFSADTWRGSFGSRHVQMLYRELRTFGGYYQSHIMGDVSRLLKHHDAIVITVGLGLWYNDN